MKRFISSLCALSILFACTQEEPAPIRVESIELDSEELELIEGNSISLVATILPKDAENQNVIWSSSNKAVASVKDGEVTAVSVGEATITAKSEDGGKKATCVVTVKPKHISVTAVSLDKTEVEMNPDDKVMLTATIAPENASNKSVLWSCSDESIATVKDGEVTALKVGEAIITATSEDGEKKATCKVTVNAKSVPVTGVSLNKQKARVFINNELTLIATIAPEDATNKTLIWTTSNALVATVKNGVVKGISIGEADITVKTEDGNHSATCKVSVTEESQTQTKGPLTLDLGTVTSTTATFNGVLDVDMLGDYDMNAGGVGFIYAPVDQPLNIVTSTKVQISEVDAQGKFTHTLTGLKYNSEYHYAIFVYKNTICQYGETQVFETVPVDIELSVKDITQTRATIAGRLTLPENDKELEVGVLCSTSSDMTIATEGVKKAVVTDIMDADGGFSHRAEKLLFDTTHYYRYYVKQGDTYTYYNIQKFKTETVSVTLSVSDITQTTATFNGKVILTESNAIDVGILYSTGTELVVGTEGINELYVSPDSSGKFSLRKGLQCGTTYNYCYYVYQNGKYLYGESQSFTTSSVNISVSAQSVTQTTATFTGHVELSDDNDIKIGIIYSTGRNLTTGSNKITWLTPDLSGNFSFKANNLKPGTTYNYCYCCTNQNKDVFTYGPSQEFRTEPIKISATVEPTMSTVILHGNVELTEEGVLEVGIRVNGISKKITPDPTGRFLLKFEGLRYETTYDYDYYIYQNREYTYHNLGCFKTPFVTISAVEVGPTSVRFEGEGECDLDGAWGVLYTTNDILKKGEIKTLPNGVSECKFARNEWVSVGYSTKYYYCPFLYSNTKGYICGDISTFTTSHINVTVSAESITQTTATLTGKIDPLGIENIEVGVLYSISSSDPETTTSGVTKVVLNDLVGSDGNFTYKAEKLLNGSTYYYRSYSRYNDFIHYGEVGSFKTEKVPVTMEVESIDKNVVAFKGNVLFSEAGVIEIGVQYYPKSTTNQSAGIQTKAITEISENGDFSVEVSGLLLDTEYDWQYYLLQNGITIVGQPQTFKIADLYNVQSDLNILSASDLSSSASANCYIISESGLYKFKTVKGNSSESVGSVASASILWETFGTSTTTKCTDLISGFCYKDGYIAFQTADAFREGNAVIAAKDASGNILWSWHIWLTDQPQGQVYYNNAGTMMDRNLGATSATPGDVGVLGLLYQWGRKDPFLGSSSISSSTQAKSTITWSSTVYSNSSNGTIEYATAHPTTFIVYNSNNFDWYYTGGSSTDNTRWSTSDKTKSIYDPCPAGWRVPDGGSNGIWSKALGADFKDSSLYDSSNEGMNFSGKFGSASTIWYPASGYRSDLDGGLDFVGSYGYYWSASPDGFFANSLYFYNNGSVKPSTYSVRARGYSVRCLQE